MASRIVEKRSRECASPVGLALTGRRYRPAPMRVELPYRAERGFDAVYGLEITGYSEETVTGQVMVRDVLKQPAGLVHGGVFASIAESLALLSTAFKVIHYGNGAVGLSSQTNSLRPPAE